MNFTDSTVANGTKGAVHGALLALAALCTGYNVMAYVGRHQPHLLVNAAVYGSLVIYECYQVEHHCKDQV